MFNKYAHPPLYVNVSTKLIPVTPGAIVPVMVKYIVDHDIVALLVMLPVCIHCVCPVLATNPPVQSAQIHHDKICNPPVQGLVHIPPDNTNHQVHGSIHCVCPVFATNPPVQSAQIHHDSICNVPVQGLVHIPPDNTNHHVHTHCHHDNIIPPLKHGSIHCV